LSDLLKSIKEAYAEIAAVIGIIDFFAYAQSIIDLSNLFDSGQITMIEYLIRFVFQFIIIPAIPSILIGLILHWIKKQLRKRR
jgi:hypothetical protein